MSKIKVVIQGASNISELPGFGKIPALVDIVCVPKGESLHDALDGAEVLLGWDFKQNTLRDSWQSAGNLKWIHWMSAGVDAVLFDELQRSDVILTNSRGIFDRAMAEYVLGYMLAEAKGFRQSWQFQNEKQWHYKITQKLQGNKVLVVGVGSIGREIAQVLKALGLSVSGVGRTARCGDACFSEIFGFKSLQEHIHRYDWVISVLPSTKETQGLFNRRLFSAMRTGSYFINVGRGAAVVEQDLYESLSNKHLAGALLDVFCTEPLPSNSVAWEVENLVISPHISGDYEGFQADMVTLFKQNLKRYLVGDPLHNLINKNLGFAAKV